MNSEYRKRLFLVDDDAVFLKALEIDFRQLNAFAIETFSSGEQCVSAMSRRPDIVILDYLLDGTNKEAMNGIETLDKLREINPAIAVIMLSAQDKIEVAVECMRHKAFDYVVKSETAFVRLQKIIGTIFIYRKMEKELSWYMQRM